jgi:hypothetical protein
MEKNDYIFTNSIGATGSLGAPDMQAKFGTQFISTGKFSVQGNREFDTYANALSFVQSNSTAFPGIIITVSDDTTITNNGAYLVQHGEVNEDNTNGLIMIKLSSTADVPEEKDWEELTDEDEPNIEEQPVEPNNSEIQA